MTATPPASGTADPRIVWELVHGYTGYWTVVAAIRVGVFDALAGEPAGVTELAARVGAASAARLEVLCDALVGLDLLARDRHDRYALAPTADAFLVSDRPGSMRDLVLYAPGPYDDWPVLDVTIRTGAPPTPLDDDESGAFYARLVRATFPTQYAVARQIAVRLHARGAAPGRIVDLGAGAAPWSIALLEAFPDAHAVVNDLPAVLPAAREQLELHGLTDRIALLPGDYRAVDLGAGAHVVVLGHVLRAEGTAGAPALVARAVDALAPGGLLVVAEYFVDDDRRGPRNALLLGVTMLAATRRGRTFTGSCVQGWLEAAGLGAIERIEPMPFQQVMIAEKRSHEGGPR